VVANLVKLYKAMDRSDEAARYSDLLPAEGEEKPDQGK